MLSYTKDMRQSKPRIGGWLSIVSETDVSFRSRDLRMATTQPRTTMSSYSTITLDNNNQHQRILGVGPSSAVRSFDSTITLRSDW